MNSLLIRRTLCLALAFVLAGCVNVQNQSPVERVWSQYLESSPFSYPQNDDGDMVDMLGREIARIPLAGADAEVADHIRAARDWAEDYPGYLAQANQAYNRVYRREAAYNGLAGNVGSLAGAMLSENRGFGGTIGSFIGEFLNEMRSRGAAARARAEVMRPIYERALLLAEAEHRLNARLGFASTNYLRRMLGRY